MIDVADLPCVRVQMEIAVQLRVNNQAVAAPKSAHVPAYPAKTLALEDGRYRVVDRNK